MLPLKSNFNLNWSFEIFIYDFWLQRTREQIPCRFRKIPCRFKKFPVFLETKKVRHSLRRCSNRLRISISLKYVIKLYAYTCINAWIQTSLFGQCLQKTKYQNCAQLFFLHHWEVTYRKQDVFSFETQFLWRHYCSKKLVWTRPFMLTHTRRYFRTFTRLFNLNKILCRQWNIKPCTFSCCHVMSCHVMSCHVMFCHVMSCHVMSCHAISCHVTSCHAM